MTSLPSSIPTKLRWKLSSESIASFPNSIPSKGLRKFEKRLDQELADRGITCTDSALSAEEFRAWLEPYTAYMRSRDYEVLATEEWFQSRLKMGKTIKSLSLFQAEAMIGSEIYHYQDKAVTSAFRFTDPTVSFTVKQGSLGAALDLIYLREMIKHGFTSIAKGRSRNAFGVVNRVGNLLYKLRFGLTIEPDSTSEYTSTIPESETKSTLFFVFSPKKTVFIRELESDPIPTELYRYLESFEIQSY